MKTEHNTNGAEAPSSIPLPNVKSVSAGAIAPADEKKLKGLCPSDTTACSESSSVGVEVEAGFFDLMQAANRFSSRYPCHKVKISVSADNQPQ